LYCWELIPARIKKSFRRKGEGKMPTMEFQGKQIEVDEDGYLLNLDDWTKDLAGELAKQDGMELTDAHWEVITFLRDYYKQYQIAPMIKILVKEIGKAMGPEKGNTKYLYELYPGGPAKQACKYAGLPKPTGCV
jgi:dissimilatory sulfite reductase related protein